jgi:hypothetical protein
MYLNKEYADCVEVKPKMSRMYRFRTYLSDLISIKRNNYGKLDDMNEVLDLNYVEVSDEKIEEIKFLIRMICSKGLFNLNNTNISHRHINIAGHGNFNTNNKNTNSTMGGGIPTSTTHWSFNITLTKDIGVSMYYETNTDSESINIKCNLYDQMKGDIISRINESRLKTVDTVVGKITSITGLNRDKNLNGLLDD